MEIKLRKRAERLAKLYVKDIPRRLRKDYVKALKKKGLLSDVDSKGV